MSHKAMVVPVLLYRNVTMIWRKKGSYRIRIKVVQTDNFRGLLGIMKIYNVEYMGIRVIWNDEREINKRDNEIIPHCLGYIEWVGEK